MDESKLILQLMQKLGVGSDEHILQKSTELLRLLQLKSIGSLGDYAKAVICIDLACGLLASEFDYESGLKLSGLKKSLYQNHKRIIEKLLDLNKPIGIYEICVQLGVNQVQEFAKKLLEKYRSRTTDDSDLNHPQYSSMAVYQACKVHNVKVSKKNLINFSHLKPAQWTLLEKAWEKVFTSEELKNFNNKIECKQLNNNIEDVNNLDSNKIKEKYECDEKVIETYEMWKERILKKAYKALEEENSMEFN